MVKRDYYEVLGIDRGADQASVKKAYRNMAMKHHPDKNPDDARAAETMKEVNEAYAILSDERKRSIYDRYGHAGLEGFSQEDIFGGIDFGSLFNDLGFGFGDDMFGGLFGRGRTRRRGPTRGPDLRYDLEITLEEAAFGLDRTIEIPHSSTCPECHGSGAQPDGVEECTQCRGTGQTIREQRSGYGVVRQISVCGRCRGKGKSITKECPKCHGNGAVRKTSEIRIKVPPGADTGYSIRVPDGGEAGEAGPGDLYVVVNVQRPPVFERHNEDIYLQHNISFATAALGGRIEVPGLDGTLKVDVKEGTQTGTVHRLPGHGIPLLGGRGRGDAYVVVRVVTPTGLTHKEKELLKQFQELGSQSEREKHGKDRKS